MLVARQRGLRWALEIYADKTLPARGKRPVRRTSSLSSKLHRPTKDQPTKGCARATTPFHTTHIAGHKAASSLLTLARRRLLTCLTHGCAGRQV